MNGTWYKYKSMLGYTYWADYTPATCADQVLETRKCDCQPED